MWASAASSFHDAWWNWYETVETFIHRGNGTLFKYSSYKSFFFLHAKPFVCVFPFSSLTLVCCACGWHLVRGATHTHAHTQRLGSLFPVNAFRFLKKHFHLFVWTTPRCRMPDQISVSEFLSETTEDYNSPTTSSFTTRLQSCRNTVSVLEEVRATETWPACVRVYHHTAVTARRLRKQELGGQNRCKVGNIVHFPPAGMFELLTALQMERSKAAQFCL